MSHSTRFAVSTLLTATLFCLGCSSHSGGETAALQGGVEKGPFILGSSVMASVVDAQGNPTGESYATQTTDQAGAFSLANVPLGGVSFQAEGFYYDEVTGTLSTAPITLRSYYDVTSGTPQPAFINVITHLAHDRVQTLLGQGVGLDAAIAQAEGELVKALGIGPSGFTLTVPASSLDEMGGDNDANAYLFAVSTVFVQAAFDSAGVSGPVDAKLQQMLDDVAAGLAPSGTLTPALTAPLETAAGEIDVSTVETFFGQYLASIGVSATVPDLTRILSTSTGCIAENTLQGNFTIINSMDIAQLSPYRCIAGDLTVDANGLTVSLPDLRQIGGQLTMYYPATLDLPALTTIVGAAQIYTPWNLPSLKTTGDLTLKAGTAPSGNNFPALTTAGEVTMATNVTAPLLAQVDGIQLDGALTDVSLPGLTTIGNGGLASAGLPDGLNIDLPALTTAGGVSGYITVGNQNLNVPNLQSACVLMFTGDIDVSLPALANVVDLVVTGQVKSVSAPVLATMYGYLNLYSTQNLTTLSLPALATSAGIAIYNNSSVLTQVSFPALTSAGSLLNVYQNPALPQCQVDALDAQLVAAGWTGSYTAYSNGTGSCP